jgi:hypothetical protein
VKSYCVYEVLEMYPPLAYSITGLIYMMQSIEILTIKEKTGIEQETRDLWAQRKKRLIWAVRIVIMVEVCMEFAIVPLNCAAYN